MVWGWPPKKEKAKRTGIRKRCRRFVAHKIKGKKKMLCRSPNCSVQTFKKVKFAAQILPKIAAGLEIYNDLKKMYQKILKRNGRAITENIQDGKRGRNRNIKFVGKNTAD